MLNACLEKEQDQNLHAEPDGKGEIAASVDDEVVKVKMEVMEPIEPLWFDNVVEADDEVRKESTGNTGRDVHPVIKLVRLMDPENKIDREDGIHRHIGKGTVDPLLVPVIFVETRIPMGDHVHEKVRDKAAKERNDRVWGRTPDQGARHRVGCKKHSFSVRDYSKHFSC